MSTYTKHFIPLDTNPDVFNFLIRQLGVAEDLSFQDIWSLDDVTWISRPALALILTFPTSDTYENDRAVERATPQEHARTGTDDIIWFKQTINNACGLYAILHAVCNGNAAKSIQPRSLLAGLLHARDPAQTLEASAQLEAMYNEAARKGDSTVPEDSTEEVDYHYVCFVKNRHGEIVELDGDAGSPKHTRVFLNHDNDLLSEDCISIVRKHTQREQGDNLGFNLMALIKTM